MVYYSKKLTHALNSVIVVLIFFLLVGNQHVQIASSFLVTPHHVLQHHGRQQHHINSNSCNKMKLTLKGEAAEVTEAANVLDKDNNDFALMMGHLTFCFAFAITITIYEGFDCSYLKPEPATIRNYPYVRIVDNKLNDILELMMRSTRGMGRGIEDRDKDWYEDTYYTSKDYPGIVVANLQEGEDHVGKGEIKDPVRTLPSYNEIMLQHRESRVPSWQVAKNGIISESEFKSSLETVITALEQVQELKNDINKYDWDKVRSSLRNPSLTFHLQAACSILQQSKEFLSQEARDEIGFDWGSCAWRHCGARADAQEAIAQLYNSVGLFEPFECLFSLDIVERSLRDIITVIPESFKPSDLVERVGNYKVYKVYEPEFDKTGAAWDDEESDDMDLLDKDYLDALNKLKFELNEMDEEN